MSPDFVTIPFAGDSAKLTVVVRDGRGRVMESSQVVWHSVDPRVAIVNATGHVIGVDKGTVVIRGAVGSLSDSAVVTVSETPYPGMATRLEVQPRSDTIPTVGGSLQLRAIGYDAAGNVLSNPTIAWFSLDAGVASVGSNGRVLGKGKGVARIVLTGGGRADTAYISVDPGATPVHSVVVSPRADTIYSVPGVIRLNAVALDATGRPIPNEKVTLATLDPDVAVVDGSALVTATAPGMARITASHGKKTDTAFIAVSNSPETWRVTITPKVDTIPKVGDVIVLDAEAVSNKGVIVHDATIRWSSLDPHAVVVGPGQIAGVREGVARITAKYKAGIDTAIVYIAPAPASATPVAVAVTPAEGTIDVVGGTLKLTATVLDEKGSPMPEQPVSWRSLSTEIATVDSKGVVKGVAHGKVTIEAFNGSLSASADVTVEPVPVATKLTVDPKQATISSPGGSRTLYVVAFDSNGTIIPGATATWRSLDTDVISVSGGGAASETVVVTGLAAGIGRVTATSGTVVDTGWVTVNATSSAPPQPSKLLINPKSDTIKALGGTLQLVANVLDAENNPITGLTITWTSLDPAVATTNGSGLVTGVATGVARIRASYGTLADTAVLHVAPTTAPTPSSVQVSPKTDTIPSPGGTTLLTAKVLDAQGNVLSGLSLTWTSLDTQVASVTSTGVVTGIASGLARIRVTHASLSDTARVWVGAASSPSPGTNVTPTALRPSTGSLIRRSTSWSTSPLVDFDYRFQQTEEARYADYLKCRGTCVNDPMHYGGLRSRLNWAIRNGGPIGKAANDSTQHAYARGRTILKDYLIRAQAGNYAKDPHHNTALADIEAYWLLEGDQQAYDHIHVTAARMTTWGNGRLEFTHDGSDARQVTVALQAFSAAHRLGIPYARSPANTSHSFDSSLGSWKAAWQRQLGWIEQNAVKADGSIPSPAHGGEEAYLFNAWLATTLLQWCGYAEWDARAFQMARLIMDHLIDVHKKKHSSWETLPYTTNGTSPAHDLAAFYIWPSLALWQETGDAKYYNFAMMNVKSADKAWIVAMKQWNQTFSTLGQTAEALVSGVSWR